MSRARTLLAAGALLLLAVAIALLIKGRGENGPEATTELETAVEHERKRSSSPSGDPQLPSASPREVAPDESIAEEADSGEEEEEPEVPFSFDLHGRVIGEDSDGREFPPQDGRFRLSVWCGDLAQTLEVEVHAGEWKAKGEGTCVVGEVRVSRLEYGDLHPRLVQPEDRVPMPATHELEIRFRIPRETTLRVLDVATGLDLAGIELVSTLPFPIDESRHPGAEFESRILGRELNSPIAMERFRVSIPRGTNSRVLVKASGFAWALATVDFDRGGEFVVSLESGGDLEVAITGVDTRTATHLRIRSDAQSAPAFDDLLGRDGTLKFLGLAPGSYSVRAELGDWFSNPIVLGETPVTIRAGERAHAQLVIAPAPQVARADIGGVVYIASEWKAESPTLFMDQFSTPVDGSEAHTTLELERIDSSRRGFDAYRWARRGVELGKYELGTWDPSFSVVIDVPDGGRQDFELIIPAPIELSVFLVDDATGAEVVTDELNWNPRRPDGVEGGTLDSAVRDAERRRYVVRAPGGVIELQLFSWDYVPYQGVVDLSTGVREHTIRLQRSCGIALEFKDSDTQVAIPGDWESRVTPVSGHGELSLFQYGEFQRKLMVSEPGTYTIQVPKLANYRQVPLQTIEVVAGRFTVHVVRLEREQP